MHYSLKFHTHCRADWPIHVNHRAAICFYFGFVQHFVCGCSFRSTRLLIAQKSSRCLKHVSAGALTLFLCNAMILRSSRRRYAGKIIPLACRGKSVAERAPHTRRRSPSAQSFVARDATLHLHFNVYHYIVNGNRVIWVMCLCAHGT